MKANNRRLTDWKYGPREVVEPNRAIRIIWKETCLIITKMYKIKNSDTYTWSIRSWRSEFIDYCLLERTAKTTRSETSTVNKADKIHLEQPVWYKGVSGLHNTNTCLVGKEKCSLRLNKVITVRSIPWCLVCLKLCFNVNKSGMTIVTSVKRIWCVRETTERTVKNSK